jgi:hypothetical protein
MKPDDTVTVKAVPVRSLQKFIEAELTPEQRAEAFSNLPPEWAEKLKYPVLATETIPVSMVNRLTVEAAAARGEPMDQFAHRAGKAAASEAMSGIYRFFALVMTPSALLSRAAQVWHTLYSRGQLKVSNQTDHSATLTLVDFPTEPAGCGRIRGWVERLTELTGVKNIRVVHTKCRSKGATDCEWDVRWGK